jgi:hypothetical protein
MKVGSYFVPLLWLPAHNLTTEVNQSWPVTCSRYRSTDSITGPDIPAAEHFIGTLHSARQDRHCDTHHNFTNIHGTNINTFCLTLSAKYDAAMSTEA